MSAESRVGRRRGRWEEAEGTESPAGTGVAGSEEQGAEMAPRRRQSRGGCSPSWISSVALRIAAHCEQNKLRQHNVCLGSWTSGLSADPHPPSSMSRGSIRPWMGRSRGPSHGPGRPHGCWPSSLPRAGPPAGGPCATTAAGVRWPSASPRPPEKRAEDSRGVAQGRTRVRDKAGLSV